MEYQRVAPLRNYNKMNNTRKCKKCEEWLDLSEFSQRVRLPSPTTRDTGKKVPTLYYRSDCKKCSLKYVNVEKYTGPRARKEQHKRDPRKVMLMHARLRAKLKGIQFDITHDDIQIPKRCPLLNILIEVGKGCINPGSPTIDRLIGSKGYTKGNVLVISHKANTVKSDLSIEQLELLTRNLRRVLDKEEELLEN